MKSFVLMFASLGLFLGSGSGFHSNTPNAYLVFSSATQALARADEIGDRIGYSYWAVGVGTKRDTMPVGRSYDTSYKGHPHVISAEFDLAVGSPVGGYQQVPTFGRGYAGSLLSLSISDDGGSSFNFIGNTTIAIGLETSIGIPNIGAIKFHESWAQVIINPSAETYGSDLKIKISDFTYNTLHNGSPLSYDYLDVNSLTLPYAWGDLNGSSYAGYNSDLNSIIEVLDNTLVIDVSDVDTANFKMLLTPVTVPEPSTYAFLLGGTVLGYAFWRRRK